jgi:threonine/homoserine/homoserine lactone efflux protein
MIIWSEIILISILWRIALCRLFSIPTLRALYRKYEIAIERLFGGLLILLGWRMASEGGPSRTAGGSCRLMS